MDSGPSTTGPKRTKMLQADLHPCPGTEWRPASSLGEEEKPFRGRAALGPFREQWNPAGGKDSAPGPSHHWFPPDIPAVALGCLQAKLSRGHSRQMSNAPLCICPAEAILIPFLTFSYFHWGAVQMVVYKIPIFKTVFLHVANTISSTLGG